MANDSLREQLLKNGFAETARPAEQQTRQRTSGYTQQSRPSSNYNQQRQVTPVPKVNINLKAFDVVAEAEKAMRSLQDRTGNINVTRSQIRKYLTAVNVVRNKVELFKAKNIGASRLPDELVAEVKFLKINLLYQAGRANTVKKFMEAARLDSIIDSIGDETESFIKFTKYVEALVAYHKFLGGRD